MRAGKASDETPLVTSTLETSADECSIEERCTGSELSDASAHGLNERVAIPRLYDGREFMFRMVKAFAQ
ncbi:hypothetical protein [Noviherbaspirillum pedocola]|uniref:Uncharacterized protein n=1 Tax=Noviherbaspirillum pedocola TaxID=2801341 RepID=A0A934SSV5_9BURK|nr:hypothetical protein [Noviherbaspirillum pedocola]MBK4734992.1 hypothetical protein [Noviherbaspirillum pedocola]